MMLRPTGFFPFSFLIAVVVGLSLLVFSGGCASMSGKKSTKETPVTEKSAFEKTREEQSDLAAYTASAGRANPKEVKEVSPGQTFLLSSKAKEIYRNTER